jgi:hypothetical protein
LEDVLLSSIMVKSFDMSVLPFDIRCYVSNFSTASLFLTPYP